MDLDTGLLRTAKIPAVNVIDGWYDSLPLGTAELQLGILHANTFPVTPEP